MGTADSRMVAYITHSSFAKHEMGLGHPECPDRLRVIREYLLTNGMLELMSIYDAPQATREQLLRAHSAELLDQIEATAPTSGYAQIDPDTCMNAFTLTAAKHAAGAAVLATDLVMSGEVKKAFCAVRPPGHHAEKNTAMGFCFFNNVAVGIRHAQLLYGVKRVALIDFDVHHGNGSEDIFAGDNEVLMLSTFQRSLYPFKGEAPLASNMHNVSLAPFSKGDAMRSAVTDRWLPALKAFRPELIYISAGFDAHRDDELANLGWLESDYAWVTAQIVEVAEEHAQGRIISVLEGGYAFGALASSVGAHVNALLLKRASD